MTQEDTILHRQWHRAGELVDSLRFVLQGVSPSSSWALLAERRLPPVLVVGGTRAFGGYHRRAQRRPGRAAPPESTTIRGFLQSLQHQGADTLSRLVDEKKYNLIIFPERFAKATLTVREQVLKRGAISPVFAMVPDFTMITGDRMQELQTVISLAIGTKLEL